MNYQNKLIGFFLLAAICVFGFSCSGDKGTPTDAYKKLFAAVKAKDTEKIKSVMSKNTLGLAQFNADRQKITIEKSLENGLVAPTMSDALTEIRDERVKGNFASIEVFNQKENRWEDLPFILEDGSWKLAIGDLFQGKFESPGKGKAEIEREATNTMPMPTNGMTKFPELPANANSMTFPANATKMNEPKSVEVPKEDKPKK
jgi:hypothetical protein